MGRNLPVVMGESVGIVAAQAIGEPGTQLTMRTFHTGGVATDSGDITGALPRVEELFNRRIPKSPAVLADVDGDVLEIGNRDEGQYIKVLVDPGSPKAKKHESVEYDVVPGRIIKVKVGEKVTEGQTLTSGPVDIAKLFKLAGRTAAENYILQETHDLYSAHGSPISRKHLEIIVRQMFSRRRIVDSGDTVFQNLEIVNAKSLDMENERVKAQKEDPAVSEEVVLGITDVNMTKESFLASAAFENTQRLLTKAALRGGVDHLNGLKENIIIGRLIPAGTGYKHKDGKDSTGASKEEE